MNGSRKPANGQPVGRGFSVHPKLFVFFDKGSGTPRFQVGTDEDLVGGLVRRTMNVIEGCSNAKPQTSLSLRQDQVLAGITQNLSNEEIASKLNISERTVKFHVSALLLKFDVRGRVDLMLEASNILPHEAVHPREQKMRQIPVPVPIPAVPVNVRGRPPALARVAANAGR